MPAFLEDETAYRAKLEKFMRENPGASEDDLKTLFPKANSAAETWKRFNASARRNRGGKVAEAAE